MSWKVEIRSLAVSRAPQSSSLGTDRVLRGATLVLEVGGRGVFVDSSEVYYSTVSAHGGVSKSVELKVSYC